MWINIDKLDHYPVMCTLDLTRKKPKQTTKVVRDFWSVNCASFAADVSAQLSAQPVDPLNGFDAYLRAISAAVNDHVPSTTKTVRLDSRKPWYNAEIHTQRLHRRKLERRWRQSRLTIDKDL